MIVEHVTMSVQAGREAEFAAFLARHQQDLADLDGCLGVNFGQGVEDPLKFILVVAWQSVAHHKASATAPSEGMAAFRKDFMSCLDGMPRMEHFDLASGLAALV